VQLCVPFRMVLRVGVEVEDADADVDVLGERALCMRRPDGWPFESLCAVDVMLAEGELRVAADGRIRPRTKWPSERIEPMCSTFSCMLSLGLSMTVGGISLSNY